MVKESFYAPFRCFFKFFVVDSDFGNLAVGRQHLVEGFPVLFQDGGDLAFGNLGGVEAVEVGIDEGH